MATQGEIVRAFGVPAITVKRSVKRYRTAAAALGCGATRLEERLLASVGVLKEAPPEFVAATDVPGGGLLCALPALLLEGLLRRPKSSTPPGAGSTKRCASRPHSCIASKPSSAPARSRPHQRRPPARCGAKNPHRAPAPARHPRARRGAAPSLRRTHRDRNDFSRYRSEGLTQLRAK